MTEPIQSREVGELRIFAGTRSIKGWARCDGQLLAVNDYPALFAKIGKRYGGDGVKSFALPDFRGRAPLHYGNGVELAATGSIPGEGASSPPAALKLNFLIALVVDGDRWAGEAVVGEIRMYAGDKLPRGFVPCDGRPMSIRDRTALFAVIGDRFTEGRRAIQSFALPDLKGIMPIHARTVDEVGDKTGSMAWELSDPKKTQAVVHFAICVEGNFPTFDD
jgi:microcystin-dependent protein